MCCPSVMKAKDGDKDETTNKAPPACRCRRRRRDRSFLARGLPGCSGTRRSHRGLGLVVSEVADGRGKNVPRLADRATGQVDPPRKVGRATPVKAGLRRSGGQRSGGSNTYGVSGLPNVCLVLITPDSSEIRWVPEVPEPGVRVPGRFPETWLVIDEVLQSGVTTYTVFGSTAPEGRMDHAIDQALDLAAGALDRVQESAPATLRPPRLNS